jgi:hypothetical protein
MSNPETAAARDYDVTDAKIPPQPWKLSISADRIHLSDKGDASYTISHDERHRRMEFIHPLFGNESPYLMIDRKMAFRLPEPAFKDLNQWVGPPTVEALRLALQRHLYWWTVPLGVIGIIAMFPRPANPTFHQPARSWSYHLGACGLGMILTGTLYKVWPHRCFFLLSAAWWLFFACNMIGNVMLGWSPWFLLFLPIALGTALSAIRKYRRFGARE